MNTFLISNFFCSTNRYKDIEFSYINSKQFENNTDQLNSELESFRTLHSIRRLEIMTRFVMKEQQTALCNFVRSDASNSRTSYDQTNYNHDLNIKRLEKDEALQSKISEGNTLKNHLFDLSKLIEEHWLAKLLDSNDILMIDEMLASEWYSDAYLTKHNDLTFKLKTDKTLIQPPNLIPQVTEIKFGGWMSV